MNRQRYLLFAPLAAIAILLTQGCTTMTRIDAATPGTTLTLSGVGRLVLPAERELDSKATKQYNFMAAAPGGQPLYGILPLHVNGKTMAGSIIFFAPALFIGGFRDVFPFYELDPAAGEIRFKLQSEAAWRVYKPSAEESARAKQYFDVIAVNCGAGDPRQRPPECSEAAAKK